MDNKKKPALSKTSPAVDALAGAIENTREKEIHRIIDTAAASMEALGMKFFIAGIDRQPQAADGGKVYTQSDMKGNDFCYMLDVALPTKEDAINLGIYIGQVIQLRTNNNKTNEPKRS